MLFLPSELVKVPAQSEFPQFSFLCNLSSLTAEVSDFSLSLSLSFFFFFNYDRRDISGNRNAATRELGAKSARVIL